VANLSKLLAGLALCAFMAAPAAAADISAAPVKVPPSVIPTDIWNGAYFGLHAGYGWSKFDNTLVPDFAGGPQSLGEIKSDGWVGGAHFGAYRQYGRFVVGGELSASISDLDGSAACRPEGIAATCKTTMDWLLLGLGRAGFTAGNWMVFGQGGVAVAGFTSSWENAANPVGNARGTSTAIGGAAGVGFEYMVAPGVVAGVDYVRLFFRDNKTMFVDDVFESLNTKLKDADLVRARISVQMGGFGSAYSGGVLGKAAPSVVAAGIWNGAYFGLHAGYGWSRFDNSLVSDGGPSQQLGQIKGDGWVGGAHGGGYRQFGSLVVGGELSASIADLDGSAACRPENVAATCKNSMDWLLMGLGRAGYASGNWMVFGQGGVAIAGFTSSWENATNRLGNARGSVTTVGGAAGVGFEYMVAPGVIAGVDYVHLFFRDNKTMFVDDVFESLNTKLKDADLVRARISVLTGAFGSASAGGMPGKAAPLVVAAGIWNGAYAGLHAGYGWSTFDNTLVQDFAAPVQLLGGVDSDGWLVGAQAGIYRQYGSFVVGGELSASISDLDGSTACRANAVASTCRNTMDWLALGLGRAGYTGGNWMVFGQGGVAVAGFTSSWENAGNVLGNTRGANTAVGGAAGVGFEYMIAPGVIAGADYVHLFFRDTKTIFVDDVFGSLNTKLEDSNLVRGRISWLWGGR
jgi:outer membrane immunogenic protein